MLLLASMLASTLPLTLAQDGEDDTWGVEVVDDSGVLASVNGLVTHGDRYTIRLDRDECAMGELFFRIQTRKDNPYFLDLDDTVISIRHGDDTLHAKIRSPEQEPHGQTALIHLGYRSLDSIAESHRSQETVSAQLLDSEFFRASDYFDVRENRWSLDNFDAALEEARTLCQGLET